MNGQAISRLVGVALLSITVKNTEMEAYADTEAKGGYTLKRNFQTTHYIAIPDCSYGDLIALSNHIVSIHGNFRKFAKRFNHYQHL